MLGLALAVYMAQTPVPPSSIDPTGGLLSYGVLGIVVVALLTGLMVPGYLYRKAEAENDRLRKLIDEKVYPAIENSAAALRESQETMREVVKVLARYQIQYEHEQEGPLKPRSRKRTQGE